MLDSVLCDSVSQRIRECRTSSSRVVCASAHATFNRALTRLLFAKLDALDKVGLLSLVFLLFKFVTRDLSRAPSQ